MNRLFHQIATAVILTIVFISHTRAQNVEAHYDNLTEQWLEVSNVLKDYRGLSEFCESPEFREYTINILSQLHHYDSVMIKFLNEPTAEMLIGKKEHKRTLKDISKFEVEYDNKAFLNYLRESCVTRNELERNKKALAGDIGMNSYDGQVLVLECGLYKFLKHIDKRIVAIEKHMYMIHPDRVGLQLANPRNF